MPPRIDIAKCNGCKGRSESFCEEVCPGDLMYVDPKTGHSCCRSLRDCWDCMSCVKACPRGAIETRIPYQLGYYKASLRPIMGKNKIFWKCVDIHGKESFFSFETRKKI